MGTVVLALVAAVAGCRAAALAVVGSGAYIAVEGTVEKSALTEVLPREQRSLGFGILDCANAVGDMVSSLYVGALLAAGRGRCACRVGARDAELIARRAHRQSERPRARHGASAKRPPVRRCRNGKHARPRLPSCLRRQERLSFKRACE